MLSIADLVDRLPKAELHIHLEGSLEPELLFGLAERNGIPLAYESVEALSRAYVFANLQEFLGIYYVGMQVLRTERDFYDLAIAYLERAAKDNVRHVEAFFDPQAHIGRDIPLEAVFSGFNAAIADAKDLGISVYLIPCFLRHLPAADALITLEKLVPYLEKIHGVGLDSSEMDFPPYLFVDVYHKARDLGLKLVAHAGEEGPPEYVWQALEDLQVDRIDHGNRAMEDRVLIERLSRQKTPLTVCPLSNLKLGVISNLHDHPLRKMLDAGIVATVNSDDPAYFGGYISENYKQVAKAVGLSSTQVITLAKNSFSASFLPAEAKEFWLSEIKSINDATA